MSALKEELNETYLSVNDCVRLLKTSESSFRRILAKYKAFIPSKKGLHNKTLFTPQSLEVVSEIIGYQKVGLTKEDIVTHLKQSDTVINASLKQKSTEAVESSALPTSIKMTELTELLKELNGKNQRQESKIRSLEKTLEKRSQAMKELVNDLNLQFQEKDQSFKDFVAHSNKRDDELLALSKKLSNLEDQLSKTWWSRFKNLFS